MSTITTGKLKATTTINDQHLLIKATFSKAESHYTTMALTPIAVETSNTRQFLKADDIETPYTLGTGNSEALSSDEEENESPKKDLRWRKAKK